VPQTSTQAAASLGRRRAAGVYGAIVTASIFTAAGGQLRTAGLAVAVVVTLVVYWVAEEYAELLGAQMEQEHLLSRRHVRAELAATWPMVTASFGPVVALVVARVCGLTDARAADVGLAAAILLLVGHAWSAGRAARLRGRQLVATTCVAAALGVAMVVLKHVVLVQLH
jgi:hypothetical protein